MHFSGIDEGGGVRSRSPSTSMNDRFCSACAMSMASMFSPCTPMARSVAVMSFIGPLWPSRKKTRSGLPALPRNAPARFAAFDVCSALGLGW